MGIPNGFVDIRSAFDTPVGNFANLIGIVVDLMPPTVISSGQHVFTFKLLDPRTRDSINQTKGLTIRFFRADTASLPKVQALGDVVLLRSIKMSIYAGQQLGLANYQTQALVFPYKAIPAPGFSIAYLGSSRLPCHGVERDVASLTLQEQAYVISLKAEMEPTVQQLPSLAKAELPKKHNIPSLPPTGPAEKKRTAPGPPPSAPVDKRAKLSTFGAKFKLISELRHFQFGDVCVQVVKIFPTAYSFCDLYVTDYTENKDMWYQTPPEEQGPDEARDGDTYGYSGRLPKKTFPGPYGWLVLKINVKEPHATYINTKIKEGDIVLLRNVNSKIRAEGAKLEGNMWPDPDNPDKILVAKQPNHDILEIQALLDRKDKYWAKRKASQPAHQTEETPRKQTKKAKRKERKQQRKGDASKQATARTKEDGNADLLVTRGDLNKHIRSSHQEVRTTAIRDILDVDSTRHINELPDGRTYEMPFINANYRARVKVVDYEPKALEDFVVAASLDGDMEMSPIDTESYASSRPEWFFTLTLEDAKPTSADSSAQRIVVHLHHEDAQFLLGDLEDPEDLRTNSQLLAKLKEKLFTLWGNLEEKGEDEPLSNRPFECCIAEYGIEMDEDDPERVNVPFCWKRHYRMFGTTIL